MPDFLLSFLSSLKNQRKKLTEDTKIKAPAMIAATEITVFSMKNIPLIIINKLNNDNKNIIIGLINLNIIVKI